ncbi:gamma-glutamylaminecyclotransferase B-like [Brachionichthys hirsutus]|uniref:gamma-glutamylaminecyclotransferase B-like n=1 Tax=Brachionichthys hirsutus TaxID=412623 RepID=UPI003604A0BA
MKRIFVYGTLMKGQPNHYRLLDEANGAAAFLGSARTIQKFTLVIATKYNTPFLLNTPCQGRRVQGEIYAVDDRMLKYLDDFERVPTAYQRTLVRLEVKEPAGEGEGEERLEAGSLTEAYGYTKAPYPGEWLSLPTYERYDSSGDHGLTYVLRELRDLN